MRSGELKNTCTCESGSGKIKKSMNRRIMSQGVYSSLILRQMVRDAQYVRRFSAKSEVDCNLVL